MNRLTVFHILGVVIMLLGKFLDLATTVFGLSISGVTESNAGAAAAYGAYGPAGLVIFTVGFMAAVLLVVEGLAVRIDRDEVAGPGMRAGIYSTYWILGFVWLAVATHNALVVSMAIWGGVVG